jgi:hypothetical protein
VTEKLKLQSPFEFEKIGIKSLVCVVSTTPTERKWFECWCDVDPWDYLILENNHNIFIPGVPKPYYT